MGNSLQHDAQGFDKSRYGREGVHKPRFHSGGDRDRLRINAKVKTKIQIVDEHKNTKL